MKKLIAKAQVGTEFLHSKKDAFFCSKDAQKIADVLNKHRYHLDECEVWYVYDYDYMQSTYVTKRIFLGRNGSLKVARI